MGRFPFRSAKPKRRLRFCAESMRTARSSSFPSTVLISSGRRIQMMRMKKSTSTKTHQLKTALTTSDLEVLWVYSGTRELPALPSFRLINTLIFSVFRPRATSIGVCEMPICSHQSQTYDILPEVGSTVGVDIFGVFLDSHDIPWLSIYAPT